MHANARVDAEELEANPALKAFADVGPQLVNEDALLKHCNKRAVSIRIVVFLILREEVFRVLHEPANYGYDAMLRCIAQRFWWARVRGDVYAFAKSC